MAEKAQIEASTMDWAKKNYELRMAKYFTDTWNLLSSHWKYLLPYSIIVTIFCKAIELIPDDYMKVSFLFLFMIPFNAGFFIALSKGKEMKFSHYFQGFKKKYLASVLIANLLSALMVGMGFVLLILPGVFLWVGTFFVTNIVIDRDPGAVDTFKGSLYMVCKHWFGILLLFAFTLSLEFFSYYTNDYGFILSLPVSSCLVFATYCDIKGQSDHGQPKLIGQNQ